jgi:hypothetical protein
MFEVGKPKRIDSIRGPVQRGGGQTEAVRCNTQLQQQLHLISQRGIRAADTAVGSESAGTLCSAEFTRQRPPAASLHGYLLEIPFLSERTADQRTINGPIRLNAHW